MKLGWEKVAERINRLMRSGQYTRRTEPNREEEIRFAPDVAAYQALKTEHPHYRGGVKVDDNLLFYGDDAAVAAPLMDTRPVSYTQL